LWRRIGPVDQYGRVLDGARLMRALRRRQNWDQLARFSLIGGSGYVVNVGVFALSVRGFHLAVPAAATIAFLVAVANNFVWNRHWTFPAERLYAHLEAMRFLAVSVAGFLVSFSMLNALIRFFHLPPIPAQMLAISAALPVSFAGNKLWTFRHRRTGSPATATSDAYEYDVHSCLNSRGDSWKTFGL